MKHIQKNRSPWENAQAMIEFALVFPVLLLLLYGIMEFGRMLFIYSSVTTASREASRYGSAAGDIGDMTTPRYLDCAGIRSAARRAAILITLADSDISIAYDRGPGTTQFATTCPPTPKVNLGDRVTTSVTFNYAPIFPLIEFASFPITSSSSRTILKKIDIEGTPAPVSYDKPLVYFAASSSDALEDAGTVSVTLLFDLSLYEQVVIPYTILGSAEQGADYDLLSSNPLIVSSGTSTQIQLIIHDDTMDEEDETIILVLGEPINAILGSPSVHTLTILDNDDPPTIKFAFSGTNVTESSPNFFIDLQLSAVSGKDIILPFTWDGTATKWGDYDLATTPLLIPAGTANPRLAVNLESYNDLIDEDDEFFAVTLGDPVNAFKDFPDVHTVTIADDDPPPDVYFELADRYLPEKALKWRIPVRLSAASSRLVTVPFIFYGTATYPDDFIITDSPVVFNPGETLQYIQVNGLEDAEVEEDEVLNVQLMNPTNANLSATLPTLHVLTITDLILPPEVHFTDDSQSISEASGQAVVNVEMLYTWNEDVSIQLGVSGSATQGLDYTLPGATIIVPVGDMTAQYVVTILEDALNENDENVILKMTAAENGVIVEPSVHTLTIVDNDPLPMVSFTTSGQSAFETIGSMVATVQLSEVSARDVTVPFVVGGTATQGTDYTITASPVIIPAGQPSVEIVIYVIADEIRDEEDEIVSLTLGAPTNGILGAITQHNAVIKEVDVCPTADPWAPPPIGTDNRMTLQFYHLKAGASPVTIENIIVNWYDTNNDLYSMIWGGVTIMYSGNESESPTSIPAEYPFVTGANRDFNPGEIKTFIVNFTNLLGGSPSNYSITVIWSNGCSLSRGGN